MTRDSTGQRMGPGGDGRRMQSPPTSEKSGSPESKEKGIRASPRAGTRQENISSEKNPQPKPGSRKEELDTAFCESLWVSLRVTILLYNTEDLPDVHDGNHSTFEGP